jgi:hypothetical protein
MATIKRYEFTLTLSGEGETELQAWIDVCDSFSVDYGLPPNQGELIEEFDGDLD